MLPLAAARSGLRPCSPTCSASILTPLDLVIANGQRLPGFVSRRKEPSPASHNFLIGPAARDVRIEPQQDVKAVIRHRKPAHAHCEQSSAEELITAHIRRRTRR